MKVLSYSTVCHSPDFGIDADLISILVLFHGILDFVDSTNLNFDMNTNFGSVFGTLKNHRRTKTDQSNLKSTSKFEMIDTSFRPSKIFSPSKVYKSRHPSYSHDHWLQVGSHSRNNTRILLVDYDNYVRML